jgi:hypothetical protein
LIVAVFNVFRAPSATVAADGVNAIFGHAATRHKNPTSPLKSSRRTKRQSGVVGYPGNPPFESYCFTRHAVLVRCNIIPDFRLNRMTSPTYFQLI